MDYNKRFCFQTGYFLDVFHTDGEFSFDFGLKDKDREIPVIGIGFAFFQIIVHSHNDIPLFRKGNNLITDFIYG